MSPSFGEDLALFRPEQRAVWYWFVCAQLGLDPTSYPLEYITIDGKLQLAMKSNYSTKQKLPQWQRAANAYRGGNRLRPRTH